MRITRKKLRNMAMISATAAIIAFVFITFFFYGSHNFDYLLVAIFTIGVAPPSIGGIIHDRWKHKIEAAMPIFLRDLSTSINTGVTLHSALEHASHRNYGPLTKELQILVAHISWGMSFEEAMHEMSERIDIPLVTQAAVLIMEAGRHGGDLSEVFSTTAKYMDNMNAWTLRRKTQTLPYVAIFYFSAGIFLFIIIVISKMVFMPIAEMALKGTPMLKPILQPDQAKSVFLHACLLESLFGGVLAGKIHENSLMSGLKHSMVLTIISGIAFYLYY